MRAFLLKSAMTKVDTIAGAGVVGLKIVTVTWNTRYSHIRGNVELCVAKHDPDPLRRLLTRRRNATCR